MVCKQLKQTYVLPKMAKQNPYKEIIKDHDDLIFFEADRIKEQVATFYNNELGFYLDLGCGAGNFIRDLAKQNPIQPMLGVELRFKRLVYASLKLKKQNLQNVRLLQSRAEQLITWLPVTSISKIFINFPDPWLKKRQQKHRMVQTKFLDSIVPFCRKDTKLYLKTDNQDYYQSSQEAFQKTSLWKLVYFTEDLYNSVYIENNIPTEFEQIFHVQKLPIYSICAKIS